MYLFTNKQYHQHTVFSPQTTAIEEKPIPLAFGEAGQLTTVYAKLSKTLKCVSNMPESCLLVRGSIKAIFSKLKKLTNCCMPVSSLPSSKPLFPLTSSFLHNNCRNSYMRKAWWFLIPFRNLCLLSRWKQMRVLFSSLAVELRAGSAARPSSQTVFLQALLIYFHCKKPSAEACLFFFFFLFAHMLLSLSCGEVKPLDLYPSSAGSLFICSAPPWGQWLPFLLLIN